MGDQKSGEASTSSGASGSNSFAMSTVSILRGGNGGSVRLICI